MDDLAPLREEYRQAKAALSNATKAGCKSAPEIQRCRLAKEALKKALEPGAPLLGGSACSMSSKGQNLKRQEIPLALLVDTPSPLPMPLQEQQVYSYDTARFPFRELVAEILGVAPEALQQLHHENVGDRQFSNDRFRLSPFCRRWHAARGSEAYARFAQLLDNFVKEFIVPLLRVECGSQEFLADPHARMTESEFAYQKHPTFRVQEPSDSPVGVFHCDAEYGHPPAEVNWWFPMTPVWESNTLFIESKPGRGDYTPAELDWGQVLRFYGNRCRHYTLANVTESCRVSFDMRVLALQYHDARWTTACGRSCVFEVGTYYHKVLETAVTPQTEEPCDSTSRACF